MYKESPLGLKTQYIDTYTPGLLYPIPRSLAREKIDLATSLPFHGEDIWNGYELSWLNPKGKPEIALTVFYFPCTSPYLVESKSLKLYLNSFTQSIFGSHEEVKELLIRDLTAATQGVVTIELFSPSTFNDLAAEDFKGVYLDNLDISTDIYDVSPELLTTEPQKAEESLYTHLLKSNCLATDQADWGSVQINYSGKKINHEGLLKYIISFRKHAGFGEHCIEQIFNDILHYCKPEKLTVYGRYTRRGGLDINPFRSNFEHSPSNRRQIRQ